MLACIACSKRSNSCSSDASDEDGSGIPKSPASREAVLNLAAQIKDTALKLSGAHRPFAVSNLSREGQVQRRIKSDAESKNGKPRGKDPSSTAACRINSNSSNGHVLSDRVRAKTSRNNTSMLRTCSGSVGTVMEKETVMEEEDESKEWTSQVEPGVLVTLVSLKGGGNKLKAIRFSHEIFNKWQAQSWLAKNCVKIMELYKVDAHAKDKSAAVPTAPKSEYERDSKIGAESGADSLVTPPMHNMSLVRGGLYASRTSSSRDADRSNGLRSRDNSSKQEADEEHERVEEDEPGVYVIVRCSPTGLREIKRVKFGREEFNEMQAKLWWEKNRVRIHEQYITGRPN